MLKRALVLCSLLLAACSSAPPAPQAADDAVVYRPIKVSAIGYGAITPYDSYTPGQKRLMAMRASKLDAYRALVEQVHGVRITSNSTVAALVAQHDSFRVYVDAYLRGAKVVTVTPMADGNYETVMEVELDERFFRYLTRIPPQGGTVATRGGEFQGCATPGAVGSGCAYGTNFYYYAE